MRVVVAGGGVGGLAAALALGRAGHQVTVVERDDVAGAGGADEAFRIERPGAPQAHQTHGFLSRLLLVLRERFPDVLDALFAAGAYTIPLTRSLGAPQPGDEDLDVLIVRRTTFEWVLRRAALAEPAVEWRPGTVVAGLEAGRRAAGIPVVTGARLADGTTLPGTVVACTGRRDGLAAWLAPLGVALGEEVHETNLVYLTRWYRFDGGVEEHREAKLGGDLRFVKYLAVPGDGGTLSVTIAVQADDHELRRRLLDPASFDRACRLLRGPDRFFATAMQALGPVRPMGGLVNRIRRFVDPDGRPVVAGLHAVGDAHTCTNPIYGRGCTLAMVQAVALADAAGAHPGDAVATTLAYEAASAREVEPWFHVAVRTDEVSAPSAAGGGGGMAALLAAVFAAAGTDPVVGRGVLSVVNLLRTPEQLATDAAFMARAAQLLSDPAVAERSAGQGAPTREQLLGEAAVA